MKILNVLTAKAIWLFDINDLNPRGKDIFPELIDWLKDAYHFEKVPASVTDTDATTKALTFERGRFQIREEIYISVDLQVFNDGIVANSRSSTRETEVFLEDVLTTAAKEFSLAYSSDMIRAKMCVSELTVRMESVLFELNPKLVDFANTISSICELPNTTPFVLSGLTFRTDVAVSLFKPSPFILEHKVNVPFSENKYFSRAPVHTDQHEELLKGFEGDLLGTSKQETHDLLVKRPKRAISFKNEV
jgi:hypothetical protein